MLHTAAARHCPLQMKDSDILCETKLVKGWPFSSFPAALENDDVIQMLCMLTSTWSKM